METNHEYRSEVLGAIHETMTAFRNLKARQAPQTRQALLEPRP